MAKFRPVSFAGISAFRAIFALAHKVLEAFVIIFPSVLGVLQFVAFRAFITWRLVEMTEL